MYLVRFCYDLKPVDRNACIETIRKAVAAAKSRNLHARLLIPQTRGREGAALEYELEIAALEVLDEFRETGIDEGLQGTHDWMRNFSNYLTAPPTVTIYRIDGDSETVSED